MILAFSKLKMRVLFESKSVLISVSNKLFILLESSKDSIRATFDTTSAVKSAIRVPVCTLFSIAIVSRVDIRDVLDSTSVRRSVIKFETIMLPCSKFEILALLSAKSNLIMLILPELESTSIRMFESKADCKNCTDSIFSIRITLSFKSPSKATPVSFVPSPIK